MNINELRAALNDKKIDPDSYLICEGEPIEQFCMFFDSDAKRWEVYYGERGEKTDLKTFKTEREACEFFFEYITHCSTLE